MHDDYPDATSANFGNLIFRRIIPWYSYEQSNGHFDIVFGSCHINLNNSRHIEILSVIRSK